MVQPRVGVSHAGIPLKLLCCCGDWSGERDRTTPTTDSLGVFAEDLSRTAGKNRVRSTFGADIFTPRGGEETGQQNPLVLLWYFLQNSTAT